MATFYGSRTGSGRRLMVLQHERFFKVQQPDVLDIYRALGALLKF
jgi:hypothetical protein